MAGEEHLHRRRVFALLARQQIEQLNHAAAIPSGTPQNAQPDTISLRLIVAAELQEPEIRAKPGGDLGSTGPAAVAEERPKQAETEFANIALVI
jgi:hypothetical protein